MALAALRDRWSVVPEDVPSQEEPEPRALDRLPLTFSKNSWLDMETYVSKAAEVTCEENAFVELAVYPPMTHCKPDVPFTAPDQMLTFKTSSTGTRRIVIQ